MNNIPLSECYRIIENADMKQMNRVELLVSPYEGIQYNYGNLKFETLPDGTPKVKYTYEVTENPKYLHLHSDKNFIDLINAILDMALIKTFATSAEGVTM